MTSQDSHGHDELEDHDLGLSHDLPRILGRRGMLAIFGGVGVAGVAGCATGSSSSSGPADSSIDVSAGEIPEETAGPFPGDGSNGPDVLTESGVVRSDITTSFGGASGVADGVPLTVRLKVFDLNGDEAAPLAGAAVYLRGVQEAADDGTLEFRTIFPACYDGRWPHLHFEVYKSLEAATSASNKLRTSQLALPQDVCETVYGTAEGYEASVETLARVSLDSDMVFADGYSLQMATVTGSVAEGYAATLNVPV